MDGVTPWVLTTGSGYQKADGIPTQEVGLAAMFQDF